MRCTYVDPSRRLVLVQTAARRDAADRTEETVALWGSLVGGRAD
jgi:hypothetical protein